MVIIHMPPPHYIMSLWYTSFISTTHLIVSTWWGVGSLNHYLLEEWLRIVFNCSMNYYKGSVCEAPHGDMLSLMANDALIVCHLANIYFTPHNLPKVLILQQLLIHHHTGVAKVWPWIWFPPKSWNLSGHAEYIYVYRCYRFAAM